MKNELKQARISTIDGRSTTGSFEVTDLTVAERAKKAFKWLAIFWGAALPFIPIPFVHLFIPAPLIIAGLVAAVRMFRITRKIDSGTAPCPACGAEVSLRGVSYREHFKETCAHCAFGLTIEFTA